MSSYKFCAAMRAASVENVVVLLTTGDWWTDSTGKIHREHLTPGLVEQALELVSARGLARFSFEELEEKGQ